MSRDKNEPALRLKSKRDDDTERLSRAESMSAKLPRDVYNSLAKAKMDLEWAVRMFHESAS